MAQKKMTTGQRFCFVSDDDGHDYLIPAEKREGFDRWLEHQGKLWSRGPYSDAEWKVLNDSYAGEDFEDFRCDSPERYTFTNPLLKD